MSVDAALDATTRRPVERLWTSRVRRALRYAARNPLMAASTVFLTVLVIGTVFAPLVAPYDPLLADPWHRLEGPSGAHIMGTDAIGRDVFSRLVYGGRVSLRVAALSVVMGTVVGTMLGLMSGYWEGRLDMVTQRAMDTLQTVPPLVMGLLIVTVLGRGEYKILIPLAIIFVPRFTRVVRGSVLSVKRNDYVLAAHTIGAGPVRLLIRHILPNVLPPILVITSLTVGTAILVEASLSFLGVGTQPPDPAWGEMLASDGRKHMAEHPHLVIFPALAISLTVFAVNMVGDALRDAWDPKLRGKQGG